MSVKDYKPVYVKFLFNASPETIFDAWFKPALMRQWLFVGPSSDIINIDISPEIRGKFSILERDRNKGEYIDHYGEFLEIVRPRRIVFTLSVPKHFSGETCVVIEIISVTIGVSELKLTQTGVPAETTEANWIAMFERLKTVIEKSAV